MRSQQRNSVINDIQNIISNGSNGGNIGRQNVEKSQFQLANDSNSESSDASSSDQSEKSSNSEQAEPQQIDLRNLLQEEEKKEERPVGEEPTEQQLIDCESNHKELTKFITKMLKSLKVHYDIKLIQKMNIKEKYKIY